ncbi:hypothetical protein P9148_16280 [Bacillus siamensis]|uniref:hypothetical protein n=1 Tax=Bacillus siamensis TaxID=659243 RepID=UPI002DBD3940|nr:hypothetical protein [Bacillus siamensis]MEC3656619.1 hypothetical protein [Bacillus siamensis]
MKTPSGRGTLVSKVIPTSSVIKIQDKKMAMHVGDEDSVYDYRAASYFSDNEEAVYVNRQTGKIKAKAPDDAVITLYKADKSILGLIYIKVR